MRKNKYLFFLMEVAIYVLVIMGFIIFINCAIDASSVINPRYTEMAKMSLEGNIVAKPENYNERVYQVCIVEEMDEIPDTIVVGSSRGMFLGKEITGYPNLYNACVSQACLEDDYALLGLYYYKFGRLPDRVIIETGPWVFYDGNAEARWKEGGRYTECAMNFYEMVNGDTIKNNVSMENPYLSLSYFQYNIEQLIENGFDVFHEFEARISTNPDEAADYPDGTIRYAASAENESEERLQQVQQTSRGACTYGNSHLMTEISAERRIAYENMIAYLQENGVEVIIYMQPFSATQCKYSFDDNLNPGYALVDHYLRQLCDEKGIRLVGDYDSRLYGLTDERFIDNIHLDRLGTNIVWNCDKE